MALTNTAILNAKPKEKPYKLTDGDGMYLQVHPNGSKYWRLKYRFRGKEKLLALGIYPEVSLATARERRLDARKLLAADKDPGEVRKEGTTPSSRQFIRYAALTRERNQMTHNLVLALILFLMPITSFATENAGLDFATQVKALELKNGGRIGISALNTGNAQRLDYRSDERFALCSEVAPIVQTAKQQN